MTAASPSTIPRWAAPGLYFYGERVCELARTPRRRSRAAAGYKGDYGGLCEKAGGVRPGINLLLLLLLERRFAFPLRIY
jgi:hypothetical protein